MTGMQANRLSPRVPKIIPTPKGTKAPPTDPHVFTINAAKGIFSFATKPIWVDLEGRISKVQSRSCGKGHLYLKWRRPLTASAICCSNRAYAVLMLSADSGILRTRLPVAANNAFATAGPINAVAGSPTPPGFSVLETRMTSIFGISAMRTTG